MTDCPFTQRFDLTCECPYHRGVSFCVDVEEKPMKDDAWCSLQITKWFAMLEVMEEL